MNLPTPTSALIDSENIQGADQCCPACSNDDFFELKQYGHEHWKIARCSGCNFVYLRNPPTYEKLADDFSWEKTSKLETSRRLEKSPIIAGVSRKSRWRLGLTGRSFDKVARYFPSGNILDIGCGVGNMKFGDKAVPFGIEISTALHSISNARMNEKGGYAVHAAAIDGIKQFDDRFFDGVVMFSYLEHEHQPSAVLQQVFRVLKPGGKAYVRVPNYGSINRVVAGNNWCGFRYPDHTNYFTTKSLRQMVEKIGFKFSLVNSLNIALNDNITAILVKR